MIFLIVDDSLDMREIVAEILQREFPEAKIIQAVNGREGLTRLEEMPAGVLPDAAVIDFDMPVMNGLEMMRAVRKTPGLENLRFIMISGLRTPTLEKNVSDLKGDFLDKPFRAEDLIRLIRN